MYDGILNVDKPKGWTSHDVVARIRRLLRQKQVGHAGTLDPMATGVLVVLLGKATRLSQYISGHTKEYRATAVLGMETDTYDAEGKVLSVQDVPDLSREEIEAVLSRFLGEIEQVPPMHSAVKKDGVPLYRLARAGVVVERKPRRVSIHDLELEEVSLPQITFRVKCSAGTYIRSLVHDIGRALGCGAHLSALVRLASGPFRLEDAVSMDKIEDAAPKGSLEDLILPMDSGLGDLPKVIFDEEAVKGLLHGRKVPAASGQPAPIARAYDENGRFLAIVGYDEERKLWQPKKVFVR